MKKNYIIISVLVFILLVIRFLPLKVPYNIYATGKVFARKEWTVGRTVDGRILATMKDNTFDQISNYGGREFFRGDFFDFELDSNAAQLKYIKKNDVIGRLYSNDFSTQLAKLENDLKIEQAGYDVFATGEKPTIVQEAQANKKLALEKYLNQKKLFQRTERLYKDSLISKQEYEIAGNNLDLLKIETELCDARLMRLQTGDKQQQLDLIQTKIAAIQTQIEYLKNRMLQFTIRAPFSGMIQHKKGALTTVENLCTILDTNSQIVITPILFKEVQFVKESDEVSLFMFHNDQTVSGRIGHIDNVIQLVGGKQAVYITIDIQHNMAGIQPGMFTQTKIHASDITLWEYSKRIFGNLFYR